MNGEVEHPVISVEDVLGAVAVVDIPVEEGDPPESACESVPGAPGSTVSCTSTAPHPDRTREAITGIATLGFMGPSRQ